MRRVRVAVVAVLAAVVVVGAVAPSGAQPIPDGRLQAIYAMSAEEMAATGAFTRGAYERLLGYIYGIQNSQIRNLVVDMVLNPQSTLLGQQAPQSYLASPAATGKGHHSYPGGLPVHALEWVEVAMAWADTYERVYKSSIDRDQVVAALVLHDWAKVWYVFNTKTGRIEKPDWYPESWGGEQGKAKWKWMGEHGAVVYAELMHRGAPAALVVGTAATHFDPHWDLDKTGEGLNPALAEAAKLAKKPPIVVRPDQRMAEWWLSTYTDGAWSFSHYVAAATAHDVIASVAQDLGLKPDSREAMVLAWFVMTRVSDFKIYDVYQRAGFNKDAAKNFVRGVVADSAQYEVKR